MDYPSTDAKPYNNLLIVPDVFALYGNLGRMGEHMGPINIIIC